MSGRHNMQAVVLAAGEGTRLRPLTENKPKGMVRVNGRPLLEHAFDKLLELGAREIITVVGYEKKEIIEHFGQMYRGVPITYAHQVEQAGLAHALMCAEPAIEGPFMLMLGDLVFHGELTPAVREPIDNGVDGTIVVEEVPLEEASRFGVCKTSPTGLVDGLVEKPDNPPTNQIITGFYTLPKEILSVCEEIDPSDRGELELTDAIDHYIKGHDGAIKAVSFDGWRVDVGYPEDRDRAEQKLKEEAPTTPFVTED